MSRANPGRVAAVRTLVAVEEGAHAEDVLAEIAPASGADRGLAWHLVLGTFRRRGAIDAGLAPFVKRGLDGLEPNVRAVLRVGMVDAHLSRTPHRAAVHQAVEVCKAVGSARASGLVNAVLRRAVGQELSEDPWLDLPPWLAKRWQGWDAWVSRMGEAPPLCIVSKGGVPDALSAEPVVIGDHCVELAWAVPSAAGRVDALPGFAEGDWWVMDPAAAAVADLVVKHTTPDATVLDACAAPGGKSFRMAVAGRSVTAVDQSETRMHRLKEGAERLGLEISTHIHQWGGHERSTLASYGAVLVDAPCTGLGTIRRHPEIRWRRSAVDPAAMGIRQVAILRAAAEHVEPGGCLVYAVCTPAPEEGSQVVERLDGWSVVDKWCSVPPVGDEDAHQAFVLRRTEEQG